MPIYPSLTTLHVYLYTSSSLPCLNKHQPAAKTNSKGQYALVNLLNKNGILILSFGGTESPGEHTNTVMGPEVYYASIGVNNLLSHMIDLGCICRHLEYDQYPELHTYIVAEKLAA